MKLIINKLSSRAFVEAYRLLPNIFGGDHSFSKYAKFAENLTFLTSWYAHVRKGVRNVSFSENCAYILNKLSLSIIVFWPLEVGKAYGPAASFEHWDLNEDDIIDLEEVSIIWFWKYGLDLIVDAMQHRWKNFLGNKILLANTDIFKDNIQYIFEPVNRNFSPEDLAFCKLFFPRNCFLNNLPLLIVVNNI